MTWCGITKQFHERVKDIKDGWWFARVFGVMGEQVIEQAQSLPGFKEDAPEAYTTTGFGKNAVLGIADKVSRTSGMARVRVLWHGWDQSLAAFGA
jgi:hypothetical protein